MVKLLITGGAGFVGSNLAKLACEHGHEVTVYDNFSLGRTDYIENLELTVVRGDIREISEKLPQDYKPDFVYHLAASGNVVQSISDPINNFDMNVVGTLSVLEYCRKVSPKRLLFSSTGGALMGDADPPVNENSVPKPISPYGASKLACEGYINAYYKCYALDYTIFRFGNVLGTNCLHKIGVVNKFYENLKKGKEIEIFGNVSRDFIYVQDLVRVMLSALDTSQAINETFHVASGVETNIHDLALYVAHAMRQNDNKIIFKDKRIGEVERNFADIRKAQDVLNLENSQNLREVVELVVGYLDEHYST